MVGFALGLALAFGSAEHTGAQRDYGSCYSYATQESAQAALDTTTDPIVVDILDHNDDGIACDNFDYAAGDYIDDGDAVMVVVCDESNGILVEVEEWIADGSLHFPSHRATDAEIAAGECAVTAPVKTPPAEVPASGTTTAVSLPNTGTGASDSAPSWPAALLLALCTATAAGSTRRRR
ncbi:MAG TPA: hypothetical protein VGR29_05720 [Thermomicrobiales bacterium]|nr:hypothetical protein [Thermomicrobiales bacterium]